MVNDSGVGDCRHNLLVEGASFFKLAALMKGDGLVEFILHR